MKTQVMLFFDTEDYTSESCADAVLALTRLLEEEGVTGHFSVVGRFAEQLTRWGRDDVKEALKRHIIGNHTYAHTMHPDIAEMSDDRDYAVSRERVMVSEKESLRLLKEHLGAEEILFSVPPGSSFSYVGMYCYHELGIPFLCHTPVYDEENTLTDYCSMTHIRYAVGLEPLFLPQFGGSFDADPDALLDGMAKSERIILSMHPNMCVKTEYWDMLNFAHGNLGEEGSWIPAKDRPAGEVIEYLHAIRMLIRRIAADDRFAFVTLRDVKKQREALAPKPITRGDIPRLYGKLKERFFPIGSEAYCISDLFYAAAGLLCGRENYLPGTVKGFLYPPEGITEPLSLDREELIAAAEGIVPGDFVPHSIPVGDRRIGPADFLFAALALLSEPDKKTVLLSPRPQSVDMSTYRDLTSLTLKGGTWMRVWNFRDEFASLRLKLQSWTLRHFK